jgi:ribosomal protein L32
VAKEEHAPPAYNQDNKEGEINSKEMVKRTKMGNNDAAAKCLHKEISHTVCSNMSNRSREIEP